MSNNVSALPRVALGAAPPIPDIDEAWEVAREQLALWISDGVGRHEACRALGVGDGYAASWEGVERALVRRWIELQRRAF